MTFTGIASEGLGASLQKLQSSFSHQTSRKVGEEGIKRKKPKINHSDYSERHWGRSPVRNPLLKLRMLRELLRPGVLVARLTTQLPVPSSQFPSLLEMATAGPSGRAQGQPRCNLCSDAASSPHVKRAFYQLPPAHVKMERGYGEVLVLGQAGARGAPLHNHGPLRGEPGSSTPRERRSLQSSLTSRRFVRFAVRHHPALQLHRPSLLSGANNLIRILSGSSLWFLLC